MSKLTTQEIKKTANELMYYKDKLANGIFGDRIGCFDKAVEALKELQHYKDLEEQGRLIEQKHGCWTGADGYSCSECSESYMEVADADAYASGWKPNYCPECGAKMEVE